MPVTAMRRAAVERSDESEHAESDQHGAVPRCHREHQRVRADRRSIGMNGVGDEPGAAHRDEERALGDQQPPNGTKMAGVSADWTQSRCATAGVDSYHRRHHGALRRRRRRSTVGVLRRPAATGALRPVRAPSTMRASWSRRR